MIAIGMLQFVFPVMSKVHQVKECCMRTGVIPRLLAIVMQTGQAHPQIDVLHQGIVCLLEVTVRYCTVFSFIVLLYCESYIYKSNM